MTHKPDSRLPRRSFLGAMAAGTATLSMGASAPSKASSTEAATIPAQASLPPPGMKVLSDHVLEVDTGTLHAVIENGGLTSLRSKPTGEQWIQPGEHPGALELVYPRGERVAVSTARFGKVEMVQEAPLRAEFRFQGWDGDGTLAISVDPENRDLLVEPAAYSSRPGVRACRWTVSGIRSDLSLVAPFFQGIRLPLEDDLIRDSHWSWPMSWEAGLAILEGKGGGFWIHTRDTNYRFKALKVGSSRQSDSLGFDTEAYGPIDSNLAAGGLCWRINGYDGTWKEPAGKYRDWLWSAYQLSEQEARRQPWIQNVALAVSWCPTRVEILDALSRKIQPKRVLLHLPNWRTDPYDENYPTYQASQEARSFLARAFGQGFRVMPHFNSVDMDPTHPVYPRVRDFQYRTLETKEIWGWAWYERDTLGVPESNQTRLEHRDKKVMVKVHPGLSMWRSILSDAIRGAARDLGLDTVFIDVTLTSGNLHNSLVESLTSTEGMNRLIRRIGSLGEGLVVGGEGLNEITFQGLSFAQAHLFRSWQRNTEGLERAGGCDLNHFLFSRLCRTIGYNGLGGRSEAEVLRYRIHREHGTIPTITVRSAEEIDKPNDHLKKVLEEAASIG